METLRKTLDNRQTNPGSATASLSVNMQSYMYACLCLNLSAHVWSWKRPTQTDGLLVSFSVFLSAHVYIYLSIFQRTFCDCRFRSVCVFVCNVNNVNCFSVGLEGFCDAGVPVEFLLWTKRSTVVSEGTHRRQVACFLWRGIPGMGYSHGMLSYQRESG